MLEVCCWQDQSYVKIDEGFDVSACMRIVVVVFDDSFCAFCEITTQQLRSRAKKSEGMT